MVNELTDANFKEALAQEKPVVVDFWAPWCGPCKMLGPVIDELAEEYDGKLYVGKMNVDENEEVCQEYGIMSIPTVLFFKNGELVNRHVGFARKPDMQQKFEALL
ncbi:MAG: thioredoxin [Paludibacteraceae bacterium]|nr:thioredoxin [Paludibacteraceae bacterium]